MLSICIAIVNLTDKVLFSCKCDDKILMYMCKKRGSRNDDRV